jgi:hypothetical protein
MYTQICIINLLMGTSFSRSHPAKELPKSGKLLGDDDIETKIKALIAQMTIKEKIGQLYQWRYS